MTKASLKRGVKADLRRWMCPPQRQSVAQISAEEGIHVVSLNNWGKVCRLQGDGHLHEHTQALTEGQPLSGFPQTV